MSRKKSLEQIVAELALQIGALGNKFGSFTEGLALPSMTKILMDKFGANFVAPRVKSRKGGEMVELDVFAYSNGRTNRAFIVEVKSHVTEDCLEQLKELLKKFPKFFPEHRDKELFGVLAGVDFAPHLATRTLKEGIYVAHINDEQFKLAVPQGFRAKSFKAE